MKTKYILFSMLDSKVESFTKKFFFLLSELLARNVFNPFRFVDPSMLLRIQLLLYKKNAPTNENIYFHRF